VKVTTPVEALKLEDPATAAPPVVTVMAAADAFELVAVIGAFTSAPVADDAGVRAVIAGFGSVVNDHVPDGTAVPLAATVAV
jgi:hypothetical protein